ncbi:NepR family anti-sigma factor [Xanthobacter sp. KR7-65]|uniref:NepR family anti-sigma factor n=1 Tax=Xanthobacter sp. KR7-65 TaxID=3156612 RepID=UPI0032B46F89
MTTQHQKEAGGMRTPHRRDISARQDLLGRELRQLFDDYTQEDMPDELKALAERLQSAFERKDEPEDAVVNGSASGGGSAPAEAAEPDAADKTDQDSTKA